MSKLLTTGTTRVLTGEVSPVGIRAHHVMTMAELQDQVNYSKYCWDNRDEEEAMARESLLFGDLLWSFTHSDISRPDIIRMCELALSTSPLDPGD